MLSWSAISGTDQLKTWCAASPIVWLSVRGIPQSHVILYVESSELMFTCTWFSLAMSSHVDNMTYGTTCECVLPELKAMPNSLRPSDAHIRRWNESSLVQIMACACSAPSHYRNQCWNIVNWTLRNKLQWNFNRNSDIFFQDNSLESVVCEMAAILSRPQCVKSFPLCPTSVHSGHTLQMCPWELYDYVRTDLINACIERLPCIFVVLNPLKKRSWH